MIGPRDHTDGLRAGLEDAARILSEFYADLDERRVYPEAPLAEIAGPSRARSARTASGSPAHWPTFASASYPTPWRWRTTRAT